MKRIFISLVLALNVLALAQTYQEAPMLTEAGNLPPVAERLPETPIVIEPVEEVGQYGGTWRAVDSDDTLGWTRQIVMVEPFVKFNRDLNGVRPNLLESWDWNEDSTQITLHFRHGIRWSDGQPLTANDFLFFWNDMVLDESVPVSAPLYTVTEGTPMTVEKIDDYTLKLTFSAPNPLFLELSARGHYSSAQDVVPAHYMRKFHPKYTEGANVQELVDRHSAGTRMRYTDMPTFDAWKVTDFRSGQFAVLERNPYYWKVDTEGNQLPYIDSIRVEISESRDPSEFTVLKAIAGELDMQVRDFPLNDMPLVMENAEAQDYRVILWDRGDFGWPWLILKYDYPDEGIVDLMYQQPFRKALSLAINRERINNLTAQGLAQARQAALSPESPEFSTPEGQAVYEAWSSLDAEYDLEAAAGFLDEIGVVDADGDGMRERPDGTKLELIVDVDVSDTKSVNAVELIKEDWEAVGIRTVLNAIEGTVITQRSEEGKNMIHAWGSAAAWGLISAPTVWTPIEGVGYAVGGQRIGQYYQTGGEAGVAPRPGSMLERLQDLYTDIASTADPEARTAKLLEAYQVHIEEGPISIGTIGEHPNPVVVKNNFRNVQETGIVASWDLGFPGNADPEQFFFKQ